MLRFGPETLDHVLKSLLSLRVCAYTVQGCFLPYLALEVAMLFYPSQTMYRDGMIANGLITSVASIHATASTVRLYRAPYDPLDPVRRCRKAPGYTILSSLLAMVAGLILYPVRWHTALTTGSLELRTVAQTTMLLPVVAVMTIPWRNSYANITTDSPPKCFIADWAGGFSHGEPLCSAIPSDEVLRNHNCSCVDMWSPTRHGLADGYWGKISYRILEPGLNAMVNTTAATFVLRLWSTFNSSRIPAGHQIPVPMLTILLYDCTISLLNAFKNERGTCTTVDAHGSTTLTVTAEYHIGFDHDPYYLYTNVSSETLTSLNMVCDIAQP